MLDGIVHKLYCDSLNVRPRYIQIDARRTPLVITRWDASFSGNLIGQNDIVLQCQAFRLNVPDHLSSPIKMAAGSGLGRDYIAYFTAHALGSLVSYPAPTSANMADDAEGRVWGLCT